MMFADGYRFCSFHFVVFKEITAATRPKGSDEAHKYATRDVVSDMEAAPSSRMLMYEHIFLFLL